MSVSREELSQVLLTVRDQHDNPAKLPLDLQGHVFVISFAGTASAPPPKKTPNNALPIQTVMPGADGRTALFDGDGMVYRFDFHESPGREREEGQVRLSSQLLKTPAFFADKITYENKRYEDFRFWDTGIPRYSILGICNQINTSLVPVTVSNKRCPRLLATNDVNRPYEIDPISLKIVAPIGNLTPREPEAISVWPRMKSLPGIFEFLISSAHPATTFSSSHNQEVGELFTACSTKSTKNLIFRPDSDKDPEATDKVFLIRWRASSEGKEELQRWEVKRYDRVEQREKSIQLSQSTHMLGVTEHYIVLADTAMKTEQISSVFMVMVGIFNTVFSVLKPAGGNRRETWEQVKDGFKALRRLVKMYQVKPEELVEPLSDSINQQLKKMPLASAVLKKPIPKTLEVIQKELGPESDSISDTELESHLPNTYRRSSSKSAEADLFRPLREEENTASKSSLEHSLDSHFQSVRHLKTWLIDKLVKKLRLTFSSTQNLDTPLYIVRREDLENSDSLDSQQVTAQRVDISGAFVHFLTDYKETENGEIVITALMTDALDPAEYIVEYDRAKFVKASIDDLSGTIPVGMDSNVVALIKVKPQLDKLQETTYEKHELTFEKIRKSEKYTKGEIYQEHRNDPLYLGLYSFRGDNPSITDLYVIEGGAFPEIITEFTYDLYKNYSDERRVPLDVFSKAVTVGIPIILTHVKVNRDSPLAPLLVEQTYELPKGFLAFSLQFVPKAGSPAEQGDNGYLICSIVKSDYLYSNSDESLDKDWSDNSELWIFDAQALSEGPQYKISHPNLNFGLTLHSTWLKHLESAPSKSYSFKQDYGPAIDEFVRKYVATFKEGNKAASRETVEALFQEIDQSFERYRHKI